MPKQYPQYRLTKWLDTSEQAMLSDKSPVVHGIQTKRQEGGLWLNVAKDGQPMFFDTAAQAELACKALIQAAKESTPA